MTGRISGLDRKMEVNETKYTGLLHANTLIGPGNSGGPMFDIYGRVIGMSALYNTLTKHSFYIPSATILKFLDKYNIN